MERPTLTFAGAMAMALAVAGSVALAPASFAAPSGQTAPAAGTAAGDATLPPGALSQTAIRAAITKAGYTQVRHLKFDDGVWEAKARASNGRWTKLKVGPVTGKVYPGNGLSGLSPKDVETKLEAAGYRNVHDIMFDDGMWEADATDSQGRKVDLLIAPDDGSVVAATPD